MAAHGFATSRAVEDELGITDWSPVAEHGERVVRFDRRGHGASSGGPSPADYEWPALAEDLLALVDEISPGAPVDGLGQSTGAGTLLWAASVAPHRFRRLVLVTPPASREDRSPQRDLYLAGAALLEQRGTEALLRAASLLPQAPILTAGGWPPLTTPDVPHELIPAVLRGAAASDLPDDLLLGALAHEALILAWEADENYPLASTRRLAQLLPNAHLEIADTPDTIRGWGARVAEFLTAP